MTDHFTTSLKKVSPFSLRHSEPSFFVDKTDQICRLVTKHRKVLLTRPSGFGKSLLTSILAELFSGNLALFENLKAKDLWRDRAYSVVRVDMGAIGPVASAEELQRRLNDKIVEWFAPAGFCFDAAAPIGVLDQLDHWLSTLAPSSLVVLVDDYEAPLTAHLDDPALFEKLQAVLSSFFYLFKSNDGCLRFFFMTGITKFWDTGRFPELNDLADISLWEEYGTLLGYTEDEIKTYFGAALKRAAATLKTSEEALLQTMRQQYGGFCFEETLTHSVYSPTVVNRFLSDPQRGLQNYWDETVGRSGLIQQFLKTYGVPKAGRWEEKAVVSDRDLAGFCDGPLPERNVLLTQLGCLTLVQATPNRYFYLEYPNEAVAQTMARLSKKYESPSRSEK